MLSRLWRSLKPRYNSNSQHMAHVSDKIVIYEKFCALPILAGICGLFVYFWLHSPRQSSVNKPCPQRADHGDPDWSGLSPVFPLLEPVFSLCTRSNFNINEDNLRFINFYCRQSEKKENVNQRLEPGSFSCLRLAPSRRFMEGFCSGGHIKQRSVISPHSLHIKM